MDKYKWMIQEGITSAQLDAIARLARDNWRAEEIAVWGDDKTRQIVRDEVRHVLAAAKAVLNAAKED